MTAPSTPFRRAIPVALAVVALAGAGCRSEAPSSERNPADAPPSQPAKPPPAPAQDAFEQRVVHEGVEVSVAIAPLGAGRSELTAHESARFRVTVRDTGGSPLAGVYPAGWMHPRSGAQPPDARACGKLIENFLSGSIFSQPEVDLNSYAVLVLNGDASISVVDPRFSFGGSKLLTMIPLGGPGHDWVLREDQSELYVSVPDAGEVSVIETYGYQPVAQIRVGEAAGRLRLQADEQYLWTAGGARLVAIDLDERQIAANLEIGAGEHDLALSSDSRHLFVSDAQANTVTVVDTRTLSVRGTVNTGWEPVSIDWSNTAGALFVAERGEGRISIVDPAGPAGPSVVGSMSAEAGLGELRFAPGGRFGFVVNPRRDLLHIFDAASRQILQTGEVASQPDHVGFSTELAYVRHAGSDTIYMIHLDELGRDGVPLQVVDFPAGQNQLGPRSSPAATIVRAPGENAVLVAHPVDRAVYYYKEGMAAPMGQFSNYRQQARAVLAVDRSLTQTAERGVYETSALLGPAGTYDLAIFIDSPRVLHCFEVEVEANPERERELGPPVRIEWQLAEKGPGEVGTAIELRVRLFDRRTDTPLTGLDDVVFSLALLTPENWQGTVSAVEQQDGEYRAEFVPTLAGPYVFRVGSVAAGLAIADSPTERFTALGKSASDTE